MAIVISQINISKQPYHTGKICETKTLKRRCCILSCQQYQGTGVWKPQNSRCLKLGDHAKINKNFAQSYSRVPKEKKKNLSQTKTSFIIPPSTSGTSPPQLPSDLWPSWSRCSDASQQTTSIEPSPPQARPRSQKTSLFLDLLGPSPCFLCECLFGWLGLVLFAAFVFMLLYWVLLLFAQLFALFCLLVTRFVDWLIWGFWNSHYSDPNVSFLISVAFNASLLFGRIVACWEEISSGPMVLDLFYFQIVC